MADPKKKKTTEIPDELQGELEEYARVHGAAALAELLAKRKREQSKLQKPAGATSLRKAES